jgi:hypothetical protein
MFVLASELFEKKLMVHHRKLRAIPDKPSYAAKYSTISNQNIITLIGRGRFYMKRQVYILKKNTST